MAALACVQVLPRGAAGLLPLSYSIQIGVKAGPSPVIKRSPSKHLIVSSSFKFFDNWRARDWSTELGFGLEFQGKVMKVLRNRSGRKVNLTR